MRRREDEKKKIIEDNRIEEKESKDRRKENVRDKKRKNTSSIEKTEDRVSTTAGFHYPLQSQVRSPPCELHLEVSRQHRLLERPMAFVCVCASCEMLWCVDVKCRCGYCACVCVCVC